MGSLQNFMADTISGLELLLRNLMHVYRIEVCVVAMIVGLLGYLVYKIMWSEVGDPREKIGPYGIRKECDKSGHH